ncbi:MAG: rod shape-determining protein [Clostridia bacterium]|nr:rod shape-determining protein [Clostridia bacterium]
MAKIHLYIDLGSYSTVIYREGKGIVLHEPSRILLNKVDGANEVVDYGQKAVKEIDTQFVVNPIMEGVITNEIECANMLREYIRRVITDKPNASVEAMFSIPCGVSAEEKQKFYNVAYSAGISRLMLVPAPVADLLGCGISFDDFDNCILVDIGSGCTDICILGRNGIEDGFTINIGSVNIDLAIASHIQSKYGVKISLGSALSLKEQIGSLIPSGSKILSVSGTEQRSGEQKTINATGFDILDALREYYQVIADSIASLLSTAEPNISALARQQGVIFCGNGSKIGGLREYMQQRLCIPVFIAEGERNVYGMQKLSQNKDLIKIVL